MKRRVEAPYKPDKPGHYKMLIWLKSGRMYIWKGYAGSDEIAEKLALKRLNGGMSQMWMMTRVR